MKVQTVNQIIESMKFRQMFKNIGYDLNAGTNKDGDKLVDIHLTTRNNVEITISLPRVRMSDSDVNVALMKLSVL